MRESKLKGPFQPAESGIVEEGVVEIKPTPTRKQSLSQERQGEQAQPQIIEEGAELSRDAEQAQPQVIEDTGLLRGEEEYARLMTIHLKEPELFPRRTEDVRASMRGKLEEIRKFVASKPKDPSRKIDFYAKAKRFLTRKEDPLEDNELITYIDKLYRTYLRGHSLEETIYNMFFLLNIHHLMAAHIGRVQSRRIQIFTSALVDSLLIHHDITEQQFAEIEKALDGISGELGEDLKRIVGVRIAEYVKVRKYADSLRDRFSGHHESLQVLRGELEHMGNQFMERIRTLRKYGIKSSYYQDGFLHEENQAWVIVDMNDILRDVDSQRGIFALISLTEKDALIKSGGPRHTYRADGISARYESSYPASASFFLKWDGELHDDSADRHLFMREIFKRAGAEAEYEMVRVSFLARIHDLVVPIELTRDLPSLDEIGRAFRPRSGEGDGQDDIGVIVQKVFLPRVRLADSRVKQLLRDDEEQRRTARAHDVKQFVKRLPAGHHPSPEAIARAREYNFILDPNGNETFVRPHRRGAGGTGFLHELQEK